ALLDQTLYAQPAIVAVELGLAELWRSWGVEPDAVAGHSIGEYAAACAAGVFDLEDALLLVAERARLMQDLPPGGSMAMVPASSAASCRTRPTGGATSARRCASATSSEPWPGWVAGYFWSWVRPAPWRRSAAGPGSRRRPTGLRRSSAENRTGASCSTRWGRCT